MALLIDVLGLTILVVPVKKLHSALPTAIFLFAQQLVLALLIVDIFRPEAFTGSLEADDPKKPFSKLKFFDATGYHLAALKTMAANSILFIVKFISMFVGVVYLVQVMTKHGGLASQNIRDLILGEVRIVKSDDGTFVQAEVVAPNQPSTLKK